MHPVAISPSAGEFLDVLGHRQRLILTGADTHGAFALIEQVSDPETGVPVHYHEREDETFHVLEGRVRFRLEGEEQIAGPGTTVFIPRGVRHGFTVVGEGTVRLLILLSPAGAEAMFRELSTLPPGSVDPAQVLSICARYGNVFDDG